MTEAKLEPPPLTQQPIVHVDGTPDASYPVRILQAYRMKCDVCWVVAGLDEARARRYDIMNEHQRERAALLDNAIAVLQGHVAMVADVMNDQEQADGEES